MRLKDYAACLQRENEAMALHLARQHSYGSNQTITGSAEGTWFQGQLSRPL